MLNLLLTFQMLVLNVLRGEIFILISPLFFSLTLPSNLHDVPLLSPFSSSSAHSLSPLCFFSFYAQYYRPSSAFILQSPVSHDIFIPGSPVLLLPLLSSGKKEQSPISWWHLISEKNCAVSERPTICLYDGAAMPFMQTIKRWVGTVVVC